MEWVYDARHYFATENRNYLSSAIEKCTDDNTKLFLSDLLVTDKDLIQELRSADFLFGKLMSKELTSEAIIILLLGSMSLIYYIEIDEEVKDIDTFETLDMLIDASKQESFNECTAVLLTVKGNKLNKMKEYDKAEKLLLEATNIRRDLSIMNPFIYLKYLANNVTTLGMLYSEQQKYNEAERYLKESLIISKKLYMQDGDIYLPYKARSLVNLANIQYVKKDFNDALENYLEALKIFTELSNKDSDTYLIYKKMCLRNINITKQDILANIKPIQTAKDFYYDYYKKTKKQKSYQEEYGRIFDDIRKSNYPHYSLSSEEVKKLKSFKPKYSNDLRFNDAFEELLKLMHDDIKKDFENYFVVLSNDDEFQAYVQKHQGKFKGEIIFIGGGLIYSIIIYTLIFSLNLLINMGDIKELTKDESKIMLKKLVKEVEEIQKLWRERGNTHLNKEEINVDILDLFNYGKQVIGYQHNISNAIFEFIIAHELGHVFLTHLEDSRIPDFIPINFSDLSTSPKGHQDEYYADIFAVLLQTGYYKNFKFTTDIDILRASASKILFTVLGQQIDPFLETESHPKIINRYGIVSNTIKWLTLADDVLREVVPAMLIDFQKLLYHSQKFGLGIQYKDNDYQPIYTK